jgi:YD repeat-containing protein
VAQSWLCSNSGACAVKIKYDKLNRLSTVTVAGQVPTTYGYDAVGNLGGYTYPNGVSTALQCDGLNRLTALSSQAQLGTVASYRYTLGAAGNRTGVTELSGRTVAYTYDNLYRLTSETIANDVVGVNGSLGYQYDAVSNRQQMASTLMPLPSGLWNYDANDRLVAQVSDLQLVGAPYLPSFGRCGNATCFTLEPSPLPKNSTPQKVKVHTSTFVDIQTP